LASNEQELELFGRLKLIPTVAVCWRKTFQDQSDSPISGNAEPTTSLPLTSSAGDSLVRTSATPASAPESTESAADCGPSTRGSFANSDRGTSSWRTSQLCLDGEWAEFSETWPRSGMTRSGKAFERPTLVRHTDENESGLLPTPTASEGASSTSHSRTWSDTQINLHNFVTGKGKQHPKWWPTPNVAGGGNPPEILTPYKNHFVRPSGQKAHLSLDQAAKMWPTPTAEDSQCKGNHPGAVDSLHAAVKLWPTPRAIYGEHPGMKDPNHLTGAVQMWATPQSRDFRTGQSSRWENPERTRNLNDQIGGQLNPAWVEWLMGYPLGWTDCGDSGTPSSRKSRNGSGKD